MARKRRIQFEGAFYHVITRGNQRQDIFFDDQDRHNYLDRLLKYKTKCGFILYAYVLMSNHIHLLIETPKEPISRIMQMINFTYTQYFNKKYGKVGHLFQGRYKAFLCDKDSYLLGLVRYIHLNPARAGLVENTDEYRWSSHKEYLYGNTGLVDTDNVLRLFSGRSAAARKKYYEFITGEPDENLSPYAAHEQQIIGDEQFIEKIVARTDRTHLKFKKLPIQELVSAIEKATGIGLGDMASRRRDERVRLTREVFVTLAKESGYSGVELQEILKRDGSVISRMANTGEKDERNKILEEVKGVLYAQSQA